MQQYKRYLLNHRNQIQPCYQQVLTAIENRERNMIKRAQYHTEQKNRFAFQRPILLDLNSFLNLLSHSLRPFSKVETCHGS